jgi:hypothetical protein
MTLAGGEPEDLRRLCGASRPRVPPLTPSRDHVQHESMRTAAVKHKMKRGRPATGHAPVIGLRLPQAEIARLDARARANRCTRSEAVRILLGHGLERIGGLQP